MALLLVVALFVVFVVVIYLVSPLFSPRRLHIDGSHVLVTGGSSGIGLAVAVEAAKQGANVTILARNLKKLTDGKGEIEKHIKGPDKQKVLCISIDLCKDFGAVQKAIQKAEEVVGPVEVLVNCAGSAQAGRFDEVPIDTFKSHMDLNYIGSVYASRAVIEGMKRRNSGRIVFTSSQAGQVGVYGLTAYSASKFALRGLAETLQMEVKPYNVYVTLTFPPDTDTPGYAAENVGKPEETSLIAETAGLFQPPYVAKVMLNDALAGKFLSYVGVDGYMLAQLTCGMSPVTSLFEALQQVLTMGLFRLISLFYLSHFDRVIRRCRREREESSKTTSAPTTS